MQLLMSYIRTPAAAYTDFVSLLLVVCAGCDREQLRVLHHTPTPLRTGGLCCDILNEVIDQAQALLRVFDLETAGLFVNLHWTGRLILGAKST